MLRIPTIGVDSGIHCDGQAVVLYQLIGLVDPAFPKPFKTYLELWTMIEEALEEFRRHVSGDKYPESNALSYKRAAIMKTGRR